MIADREITLNAKGVKLAVMNLLKESKVEEALDLFQNNTERVMQAIREYDPTKHEIMNRPDKKIKNRPDYKTHKLVLTSQKYINEVERFFLLGQPLKWEMQNSASEQEELQDVFKLFNEFLELQHYNSNNSKAKRIAGAETECAKLYVMYKDEGVQKIKTMILSKSDGYELRPLFNKYGDLKAFAIGYRLMNVDKISHMHWDIYMSEVIYHCDMTNDAESEVGTGWDVKKEVNFIGKIPVIYFSQPVAWDGAQSRIERLEEMDSKSADIIDYTDNPILLLSKSVKKGLAGAKEVGHVLQVNSKDDVVKYLEVPNQNEAKQQERDNLEQSISLITFTPDFTYKNVKGLGAISGAAISKANILGYLKRQNRMEIYDELFERDCNLIKAILGEVLYPKLKAKINRMKLHHVYQDPAIGIDDNSEEISRWRDIGGISIETMVQANRNVHNKELEVERIKRENGLNQQTLEE